MKISTYKLKKYEERIERAVEDPVKIIQIIKRIIDMGSTTDTVNTVNPKGYTINPPVPEEKKVTFYEFVKYFGNNQIERDEERGRNTEKHKKEVYSLVVPIENRIREIDGFSDYTLPEGMVIKYR